MNLNSATGALTGVPPSAGSFNFTVQVEDSTAPALSATKAFLLTVNPATLSITTSTPLPAGTVAANYSQTLAATGGTPPYVNWSVTGGALPAGLTLNSSTGVLGGIPSAAGPFNFTVGVQDSGSPAQSAAMAFSLTINPSGVLTITTNNPLPSASVGSNYSQTLAAVGGTSPYTNWVVTSGLLPAGVTLNPSTGALSGTPTASGPFTFTVQVRDSTLSSPQTASKTFDLNVSPSPLVISTAPTLPNGSRGVSYTAQLEATGGTPPYVNWSVIEGALPAGISLNPATGVLSGTTSATGGFNFTVQVQDSATTPQTATKAFSLTINVAPLSITTASPLNSGLVGQPYSLNFTAAGGAPAYQWGIATGTLPSGITLNQSGLLSGTTTQTGTFLFGVNVTDTQNGFASKSFSLTINSSLSLLTPNPVPQGSLNSPYSLPFAATGGTPPYTFALAGGSLPAGLTLSQSGLLAGAPTQTGTSSFIIAASDSAQGTAFRQYDLTVISLPLTIISGSTLPSAQLNTPYSRFLLATGGSLPYIWQITSGTLPTGLTLSSSGELTGSATAAAGQFSFTVQVIDNTDQSTSKVFTIQAAASIPTITTASPLPDATTGVAYNQTFTATGGTPPYNWSIDPGATLPAGLTLSFGGVLSGTPTTAGEFSIGILVTDSTGLVGAKSFPLNVIPVAPSIVTTSLPNGRLSIAYSQTLTATNGETPYSWDLFTGPLPPGLSLTSAGVIQGFPTQAGTFFFTPRVTDNRESSATKVISITIDANNISITTPEPLPSGMVGATYSQQFAVSGGAPPYTWVVDSGQVPAGLSLSPSGVLSGAPTTAGASTFTVRVTEGGNSQFALKTFRIAINAQVLTITNVNPLPPGLVNQPYTVQFTAAGGTAPYTWSLESGTLPAGISLSPTGLLSGVPTTAGSSTFSVRVTDSAKLA